MTQFDIRQSIIHSALPAIGTIAGATVDGVLTDINTIFAAATSAPTASVIMQRDVNANTQANNFLSNYTPTVTAGTTTTLTVASAMQQDFTGTTTQTVVLPVVSTLSLGLEFIITNLSTGIVTVQSSGGNLIESMATDSILTASVISLSGTGTASWKWTYGPVYSSGLPLTNPMTTLGDIIVGGSGGSPQREPIGLDGQRLTADSSQTFGLDWNYGNQTVASTPGAYPIPLSVDTVLFDVSSGAINATLPNPASFSGALVGKTYTFVMIATNNSTLPTVQINTPTGGIFGTGAASTTLNTVREVLIIRCDGGNWQIIERRTRTSPIQYTPTFNSFGSVTVSRFFSYRERERERQKAK